MGSLADGSRYTGVRGGERGHTAVVTVIEAVTGLMSKLRRMYYSRALSHSMMTQMDDPAYLGRSSQSVTEIYNFVM